jgi:hypothetical protein
LGFQIDHEADERERFAFAAAYPECADLDLATDCIRCRGDEPAMSRNETHPVVGDEPSGRQEAAAASF